MFNQSSASSSSSSFFQPVSDAGEQRQTALKSNEGLSPDQMDLQNQLTKACYDADVDKVKELVEKKGADPAIPDKDGQQPLAAAIWGLAFNVMDYLEGRVNYTGYDWLAIAMDLQTRHNILVPASIKIVTYGDWLKHYDGKINEWFYDYRACALRERDEEGRLTWNVESHVIEVSRCDTKYGGVLMMKTREGGIVQRELMWVSGLQCIKTMWLCSLYDAMVKRLEVHGVKFDENYQLIASSYVPPKP